MRALQDGKWLYMALPCLARPQCFLALHRDPLMAKGIPLTTAANMGNALMHGQLVDFGEMQPILLRPISLFNPGPRPGDPGS
ncbi:MAG: hypothetical protein O3A14_11210 [Cyanobacteria bacterium]|nr:hypothetical protein [Cyanobacteriota bacterium]